MHRRRSPSKKQKSARPNKVFDIVYLFFLSLVYLFFFFLNQGSPSICPKRIPMCLNLFFLRGLVLLTSRFRILLTVCFRFALVWSPNRGSSRDDWADDIFRLHANFSKSPRWCWGQSTSLEGTWTHKVCRGHHHQLVQLLLLLNE